MNNDNDNDDERNPIIGPRDWSATETAAGFQAKFGQMSQDILLENVTRHPPSAGIILTKLPLSIISIVELNLLIT